MAKANYARRRRNAFLAAVAMALVFIIIVVIIIVSIVNQGNKKKPSGDVPTLTPTVTAPAFPTLLPSDQPTNSDEPLTSQDPTVTNDPATVTPTPAGDGGNIMYVTGDGVNVREKATSDSNKISQLSKGATVTAYELSGDFYSVKLSDGKTGYIHKNYVSKENPNTADATPSAKPTTTPDTSKSKKMYVTGDKVNVRATASSSGTKVTSLVKGKEVTAYATSDGWTYIQYGTNKYGYISAQYLAESAPATATAKPTATAPATAAPATATPTATPAPTKAPISSFAELGVPSAVANKVDGNEAYLKKANKSSSFQNNYQEGKDNISWCEITTKDGSANFFVCWKGTESAPTSAYISDTKPVNNN